MIKFNKKLPRKRKKEIKKLFFKHFTEDILKNIKSYQDECITFNND